MDPFLATTWAADKGTVAELALDAFGDLGWGAIVVDFETQIVVHATSKAREVLRRDKLVGLPLMDIVSAKIAERHNHLAREFMNRGERRAVGNRAGLVSGRDAAGNEFPVLAYPMTVRVERGPRCSAYAVTLCRTPSRRLIERHASSQ